MDILTSHKISKEMIFFEVQTTGNGKIIFLFYVISSLGVK